jgi:hypothetical protein
MPNFLYLFRGGEGHALPPAEMQKSMEKWNAWIKDFNKKGVYIAGDPLETSGKVVKGKKKTITDGPFAEAKDLVGGYIIVKAKDIKEATEWSKGCPIYESDGSVEIRPVLEMEMPK